MKRIPWSDLGFWCAIIGLAFMVLCLPVWASYRIGRGDEAREQVKRDAETIRQVTKAWEAGNKHMFDRALDEIWKRTGLAAVPKPQGGKE